VHADTGSAWAATVTSTTVAVAVSPEIVQLCPGASIEGGRRALLMGIYQLVCPSAAEQGGLRRVHRSQGAGLSLL